MLALTTPSLGSFTLSTLSLSFSLSLSLSLFTQFFSWLLALNTFTHTHTHSLSLSSGGHTPLSLAEANDSSIESLEILRDALYDRLRTASLIGDVKTVQLCLRHSEIYLSDPLTVNGHTALHLICQVFPTLLLYFP